MGLLHSKGQEGVPQALWEVQKAAQAAGIPLPPPLKLPPLPPLTGGCDVNTLVQMLGPAAAKALTDQLKLPEVKTLLTSQLQEAQGQLTGYLTTLDTFTADIQTKLAENNPVQAALGEGHALLGGLRSALGGAASDPLTGDVLQTVSAACPVVGGLLGYAEQTLSALDGQLTGIEGTLTALTEKASAALNVRGKAEALLAQVNDHLTAQLALFDQLAALDFSTLDPPEGGP